MFIKVHNPNPEPPGFAKVATKTTKKAATLAFIMAATAISALSCRKFCALRAFVGLARRSTAWTLGHDLPGFS